MKVDVFKKLIKEAVREVLREELSQVQPTPIKENRTMSFTTQDVDMVAYRQNLAASMGLNPPTQQIHSNPQVASTGNPYLDIIAETAATMTPQEVAQMRQYSE
jgi:ABC-type metal ion transport system substrate-binding protein